MIQQFSKTLILSGCLFVAYSLLVHYFPTLSHKTFYIFLVYFCGLQAISTILYRRFGAEENPEKFVMAFMAITGIKFIFSLFIVLIIVLKFKEQKQLLALSFCLQYVIFLTADSQQLLRKIRERN